MTETVPAVTFPVTPLALPRLSNYQLAELAREVAMGLRPLPLIVDNYGLTEPDYEILKENHFYKRLLEATVLEWASIRNTTERSALEAAALFEQAMPHIFSRMIDGKEQLNHVVAAAQLMAKAGGIGESKRDTLPGEKFSITINLGADTKLQFGGEKAPRDVTPSIPDMNEDRV